MSKPRYTQLVESLPASVPFVGPETQERARGGAFAARLGANENVFGPSSKAIEAMQKAASEIWKYGDPTSFDLRAALADHHAIAAENIVVGEGIDGLLGYLVRMLIGPGDKVVTSDGAYPTFNYHVAGFGGTLLKTPYVGDHEDPAALLELAGQQNAKLIYFANPDNPMGTWHSADVIEEMISNVPDGCLLVLDEAYIEFAPEGTAPKVEINDPKVIRMRTFSKGYGMAGARVGYALGARDLIGQFEKIRNHFGMNRAAQAGALAALGDQDWLGYVREQVARGRATIAQIAEENGLSTVPSATNFVAIDCGRDGVFAKAVLDDLVASGLFVRMPFVAPQNRCIRVSAGHPEDLELLRGLLPKALSAALAR
ncbi:pyridoxal phosphate-dependent aminotransferase [Rhodobacteraceae bacterium]|nr:pyridoxal phosphate-dependent aminotransferase [Paracoccaceae bacterium]